ADTGRGATGPCRSPPYRLGGSLTERSNKRAGYVPRAAMLTSKTIPRRTSTVAVHATLASTPPQRPCIDTQSPYAFRKIATCPYSSHGAVGQSRHHTRMSTTPVPFRRCGPCAAAPTLLKEGIERRPRASSWLRQRN